MIGWSTHWQLGPALVNGQLATVILALFLLLAGVAVAERWGRFPQALKKEGVPWIMEALLIFLLIWKFSPLLRQPSLILDPADLLLRQGSAWGSLVASLVTLGYIGWRTRFRGERFASFSDALALYLLLLLWLQALFFPSYGYASTLPWAVSLTNPEYTYHPLHLYTFLMTTGIGIGILLKKRERVGQLAIPIFFTLGIALWLIAWLQPFQQLYYGLQAQQWLAMALIALSFYLRWMIHHNLPKND